MSEQMDLPTSRGSMAVEWAGLTPQQRERVAGLFLGLRQLLPEARKADACRLWDSMVEAVQDTAAAAASPEGRDHIANIMKSGSDPEGLAFIAHMDAIAREAVEQYRLPLGERWNVEGDRLHRAIAREVYRRSSEGGER